MQTFAEPAGPPAPACSGGACVTNVDKENAAGSAAGLATAVLEAEAERHEEQAEAAKEVLFADELLPGVGAEELTLQEGLRRGGMVTFVVLVLLQSLDELESAALSVLAPDIRDTLGVGNGVIVFVSAASGAFIVLGALPMGWLADRFRRGPIVGWAAAFFAVMVFTCGLAANAFMLFWARFGVGIAKSNEGPVQGSLVADSYPIGIRARASATLMGSARLVAALSPALVGGIAALAGGTEGWRWAYLLLGLPMIPLAVLAFRIPEPPRGQFEMVDVLGDVIEDDSKTPMSLEAAFARLNQIRTFKGMIMGFAAMGFGLFTGPVLSNLFVEERFGLESFERGVLGTFSGLGLLCVLPFVAKRYDSLYRRDPALALRLLGLLIVPVGVVVPIQYAMPNAVAFGLVGVIPSVLLMTAFSMVAPVMASVVPYRLRGMGAAFGSIYMFFIGATGGALLAAFLADAVGPRAAVLVLTIPSTIVGGLLVVRSSLSIKKDLSMVVADLREELAEARRQKADPESVPALQVHNVDFHYGPVQVLFDVGFEVRKGEVLALLGTNGAGKSTILRAIAGLGTPARGVVRLHGTTITFVAPEQRVRYGIRLLPGGKGVFPDMTVRENLEMAAYVYRRDPADLERRIARVLELFGDLAGRRDERAASLSGGQQQMLALAMTLLHDPDVLLIDELSLGLSPVVVQELLGVIERLKRDGMTIVVVEQSLNVALAIADRAVFLEKGHVRFEGDARELAERDDLARAVFLGKEGG
jgi:ABC-type branched-subunit amino acid transport system ATPase component/predicted MFS family arabinose efflux permease